MLGCQMAARIPIAPEVNFFCTHFLFKKYKVKSFYKVEKYVINWDKTKKSLGKTFSLVFFIVIKWCTFTKLLQFINISLIFNL